MRGGDKCLELVGGVPLLRVLVDRAAATGWDVAVTLRPGSERRQHLDTSTTRVVEVSDASTGMAASFRALSGIEGPLMVCLGDMPEIETADMETLIAAYDGEAPVRATAQDGTPGQPVIFPPGLVAAMARLEGDKGAQGLLKAHPPRLVPLPGQRAITDLDTPEAWSEWRARTGIRN